MMIPTEYLNQVKEHLYNGLAIMDVVGHVDDPGALWRRDSLAYVMRLAFKEWQSVEALLRCGESESPNEGHRRPSPNSIVPLEPASSE